MFKKEDGEVLSTSYEQITHITEEEINATIGLLEYENGCKVEAILNIEN